MDIPIPNASQSKKRRQMAVSATVLVLIVMTTLGLARLKPAAPRIDRSQVWTDTVKRGDMLRKVAGMGTLVPEETLWIPALTAGRVQRILVLPGSRVKAETVLVELANPEVEKAVLDAEWQLKAVEAELANVKVQLRSQQLDQEVIVANAQSLCNNARLEAQVNEDLGKGGLVPQMVVHQSRSRAEDASQVLKISQERLRIAADAAKAQLAVQEAKVEQLRAELALKRQQADSLRIKAGLDGVLQKLGDTATLQVGQHVAVGANVARVADPSRLKAELKVHETQARDVQAGLNVLVDTRNGTVTGEVVRVDPAVQNGTVTVDVRLTGSLPKGARPDLSVEGIIELEHLQNVLYVGRPVLGDGNTTTALFRLTPSGKDAIRTRVKLGRASVTTVEVVDGLQAGDQVILSDMSTWQSQDRVRIR
jgi:HlyD family secretion protein